MPVIRGIALRKRFCRKFNFELQASATEDNIVLSLTTAHSFELAEVARYLHSANVRPLLIQAMLDAPMFTARWRWVAGVALALPRFRGGRKVQSTAKGYRERAVDCAKLAAAAKDDRARTMLMHMAGAWLRLADWQNQISYYGSHGERAGFSFQVHAHG